MKTVGWDVSHMEFTIEDHYYFSILQKTLEQNKIKIRIVKNLSKEEIEGIDTLVFNYPEKHFKENEVKLIREFLVKGGTVIVAGYYNNEDNIADTINSLVESFGLKLEKDAIYDDVNNHSNDRLFVVTGKVYGYNKGVSKVMMACAAPITITKKEGTRVILEGEHTAKTEHGNKPILAAERRIGEGKLILIGTCVFWDNYSIEKYDNLSFSRNLLCGES